jgi:surface polysaccharide O-acyltransferase-like enzyme
MQYRDAIQPNNNQAWLAWLRVIATIAVIILHCCATPLTNYGVTDDVNWGLSLALRNFTAVSVPLFFMISGYLYLSKAEINISQFFRKRLVKIIIPLLMWSYFWIIYNNNIFIEQKFHWLYLILPLRQPAMYHLWFMYPLLGLYLILPLIHSFVRNMNLQLRTYALIYWVFFIGITDFLSRFMAYEFAILPQFMTIWVGYFVAGYLIIAYNFKPRWVIAICLLILTIMIVGTYFLTNQANPTPSHMYELSTIHMMLLSLGVFWLVHHYRDKFKSNQVIKLLSERSYVVYLAHPLLMIQADKLLFREMAPLPIFYVPILILITTCWSYGLAILIKMLRLNKILG